MVATVSAPSASSRSRSATASAAPALGSVPPPISSMSTSDVRSGVAQDLGISAQVLGEGRRVLRDRLLVADVGEDALESSDRRPGGGGRCMPQYAISHEQTAHLERHGLAAHVRAADQQNSRLCVEPQRLRNGALVEQRVPAADDRQRRRRPGTAARRALRFGKTRLRVHEIERRVDLGVAFDLLGVRSDESGELGKDARDLVLFLHAQRPQAIVGFQRFERFDEIRLAAGAGIVNDSRKCARELSFDGNDETPVAHGDDVVLEHRAITLRARNCSRSFPRLTLGSGDSAAQARQLGRGSIQDLAAVADRVANLGCHLRKRHEAGAQGAQSVSAGFAHAPDRCVRGGDADGYRAQIERRNRCTALRCRDRVSRLDHPLEREAFADERAHLSRSFERNARLFEVCSRLQLPRPCGGPIAMRLACEALADRGPIQDLAGSCIAQRISRCQSSPAAALARAPDSPFRDSPS